MLYITKTQKYIFAAVLIILVIISGTIYIRQEKATKINLNKGMELEKLDEPAPAEAQTKTEPLEISVYICGFVKSPGVVEVTEGTRLEEAVELLGGTTEEADLNAVNLAYRLVDEDMIYIPKKGEELQTASKAIPGVNTIKNVTANKSGKVNINTSGTSELDILEGVGPATAKAIIEYREQNGPFKTIEDIKKVKGIGDSKFNKMKDDITVE